MKFRDFPLLTDENLDPEVIAHLRGIGFDVLDVIESGLQGVTDVELLRRATSESRVVVTHDADFGTLAILQRTPLIGIAFLRPGHINPRFTNETIDAVLKVNPEVTPPFVPVAKRTAMRVSIRVRAIAPPDSQASLRGRQ